MYVCVVGKRSVKERDEKGFFLFFFDLFFSADCEKVMVFLQ